jgi:hypothetical protein
LQAARKEFRPSAREKCPVSGADSGW